MGRGLLYQYDLTDTFREDWVPQDATKIRVDRIDGLRLYGTTATGRQLRFPTSGGPWRMDLPRWTAGAFSSFVAFDAEEDAAGYETDPWTGAAADAPVDLTIEYQIGVGSSARYYWNGAAWAAVASNANANTLADVQAHLADADLRALVRAAGGQFGVSVILATTSAKWTPTVKAVRLLVDVGQPDSVDDAVIRALAPEIQAIAITGAWEVVAPAGGLSGAVDLLADSIRPRIPWDYVAISAVYNVTDDPNRATSLLSSSSVGALTQVLERTYRAATAALSTAIPEGETMRVEFTFRVPATVPTALDFGTGVYEIGVVPEVQVREVDVVGHMEDSDDSIVALRADPGSGVNDGYTITGRRSVDVELTLAPRSEYDGLDLLVAQALRQRFGRGTTITSAAFGTPLSVEVIEPGSPVIDERGRLRHYDLRVRVYSLREPGSYTATKLVRELQIDGSNGPPR